MDKLSHEGHMITSVDESKKDPMTELVDTILMSDNEMVFKTSQSMLVDRYIETNRSIESSNKNAEDTVTKLFKLFHTRLSDDSKSKLTYLKVLSNAYLMLKSIISKYQ